MSGRPTNPSIPTYTPGTWATDAIYPSGIELWSSQPNKVPAPAQTTGFIPGQGISAPYVNWLFNRAFQDHASAKAAVVDAVNASSNTLNLVGQLPAINFIVKAPAASLLRIKWSEEARRWIGCGGSDIARYSEDGGVTWASYALPAGGRITRDIDANASGHAVVALIGGSGGVYAFDGAAWSTSGGFPGATAVENARVVYSQVANLWCVTLRDSGSGMKVYTSSNRMTWTQRTTPLSFPAGGGTFDRNVLVINKTSGRIVWGVSTIAGGFYWATSDDGGLSWTYRGNIPHTNGTTGVVDYSETWDSSSGAFFVCLDDSGGPPGKILKSADGVSWTMLSSFQDTNVSTVASLGQLLVSATAGGFIIYSADGGATWRYTNQRIGAGSSSKVFGGDGCVAATDGTSVYTSLRFGMPDGPPLAALV